MLGGIVNNFVDNHRLYRGAGWNAKRNDLSLNELTDIQNVPVLFVALVFISVRFALGLGQMASASATFSSIRFPTQYDGTWLQVPHCRFSSWFVRSRRTVLRVPS